MNVIPFALRTIDNDEGRVEVYRAEHPDVLHLPSDQLTPLPVTAFRSEITTGAVTVGDYGFDLDQARALVASVSAAIRSVTPGGVA